MNPLTQVLIDAVRDYLTALAYLDARRPRPRSTSVDLAEHRVRNALDALVNHSTDSPHSTHAEERT